MHSVANSNSNNEESILLTSNDIQIEKSIEVNSRKSNVIYLKLLSNIYTSVHVLILIETPTSTWTNIIEKYGVRSDILIDSHKGIGTWFEDSYLYSTMKKSTNYDLLPPYYFKGKYISHEAPDGFKKVYDVLEAEGKHWCSNAIYKTNWN